MDADFWRLEGKQPASPNLFTTDTHDLETMILESKALEKLLTEYGSVTKIRKFTEKAGKDIRQALLDICAPIGYLRWNSQKTVTLTDIQRTCFQPIYRRTVADFGRYKVDKSRKKQISAT